MHKREEGYIKESYNRTILVDYLVSGMLLIDTYKNDWGLWVPYNVRNVIRA